MTTKEKEALFIEACKRYPIGTKFRIAHQPDKIATVISHEKYEDTFVGTTNLHINFMCSNPEKDSAGSSIYAYGNWAKVVSYPKPLLDSEIASLNFLIDNLI